MALTRKDIDSLFRKLRHQQDSFNSLCDLVTSGGIEGLSLNNLCDDDTGALVGYSAVIIDEVTLTTSVLYFDTGFAPLGAAPAGSSPCTNDVSSVDTNADYVLGTIQQSVTSTLDSGAIDPADNIRINVTTIETPTLVEIVTTLQDLSIIRHRMFGGTYSLELDDNQFPITFISVREIDDTATRATINWLSKE